MGYEFRPPDRSSHVRPPREKSPAKRKAPLRPVSKKRAKLLREVRAQRRAILEGECMVCRQWQRDDDHEIARGAAREACLKQPLLQIGCCRQCHDRIQDLPAAEQIAIKIRYLIDLACQTYNELRARNTVDSEAVISRLMFTNFPKVK